MQHNKQVKEKMMKTTIYYSVENCGDGSAYPEFFDREDVCDAHQDNLTEGWGESCTGSLTITSAGPIKVQGITTLRGAIKEADEQDQQEYLEALKALKP